METAVIYARFSCSKQREASIEDQLRVCREYAERNAIEVVREYCDRATSGRTDARPEFQNMIASAGESDHVIVYAMDRFSRDPYDAPLYKHKLKKRGVTVMSATEHIPDTPEGILLDKVIEGVAAMESAHNSIRTLRGMEGNAMKCQWNGNRIYGYSVDPASKKYIINDSEAEIVREAFSRRLDGEAPCSIASDLAMRGVRTSQNRPCSATMIENMLRNIRYTGLYKWGRIEVENGMPAIINRETFDKVQKAPRSKRRKSEKWREYPLAGKSVCMCGHNLVGKSANGNGGAYFYYQCGHGCGQTRPVRADWLEDSIVDSIREIMSDGKERERIADTVARYVNEGDGARRREDARERIRKADKALEGIMDAMKSGIHHPSMQAEIDEAVSMKERAEIDLRNLDIEFSFDKDDFATFLSLGAGMDHKTVLSAFVGQVVLFKDFIAVTLNYKDEREEPAYLEIDGFAEMTSGSPYAAIGEPSAFIIADKVLIVIPRAA